MMQRRHLLLAMLRGGSRFDAGIRESDVTARPSTILLRKIRTPRAARATVRAVRLDIAGLVLVIAATPALADHAKTDVAKTNDGSIYVGEIKSVQYATLSLDTDPAGLLSIEWRHVTALTSKEEYRIELTGGVRHFGTLGPATKPGHLNIVGPVETLEVDLTEIVEIVPIEHGFWKRLDGSVNFGLTYTQANDALQYNLAGDATYRTRKNFATLSAQSIFNTQTGGETTNQHSASIVVAQVGKNRWGAFEIGQLQSNPDQGFDLRSIIGGGATNFLVESSKKMLSFNLGAVYNREEVTDSPGVDDSVEALVGIAFRRFKHGSHSPSMQLNLETFTNVTESPRFRAVFNFNIGWKIVGDLKINFQIKNSYDSDPPGTDSRNNDLFLVTSIGYTF